MKIAGKRINMISAWQLGVLIYICSVLAVSLYCVLISKPTDGARLKFYSDGEETFKYYTLTNSAQSVKGEAALNEAIDKRLGLYAKLLGQLDLNRYVVALVVGLSLLLIISAKKKMKIPWIDDEVPRVVALRVLPLLCLFLWQDFGYNLNSCIDSRIATMRLINCSLRIDGFTEAKIDDFQKAHYTMTRSSELEDHGLLDSWFWVFYGDDREMIVRANDGTLMRVLPTLGLFWYAAIYGLLGACAFYLPTRDTIHKARRPTGYAIAILFFWIAVQLFSQISYHFGAKLNALFYFATLGFCLIFFLLFCCLAPQFESKSASEKS